MKVEFLGISMPQLVHGYHSTAMKTGGLIINFLVLSIAFETSNQIWGYFHGLVVYNHEKDKPTKLIGGLEHFLFFHSVGNIIIPTDFHIFQRGRAQPPTTKASSISILEPSMFFFSDCIYRQGRNAVMASLEKGGQWQQVLSLAITAMPGHVSRSKKVWMCQDQRGCPYGYGSIPINTIFRGMNIHLPAILMFTRGTRFWHTAVSV